MGTTDSISKIQMVEFTRRIDEGKSITEQTSERLTELHEKIQAAQEFAQDGLGLDVGRPTVYVFGSWARGTALAGQSDLDVVMMYEPPDFTEFAQGQIWLTNETREVMRERKSGWMENLFDGYDIFSIAGRNADTKLNNKFTESRDDRPEGETRIYNLTEQRFRRTLF
jgi:predicted nucleotidyltransferase